MSGTPETTTGGKALKFYASVRLDIRKGEAIKNGTEVIGNRTKIKIVKNKVAPPFRTVMVDILYGEGISREGELLDMAVEHDLIKKAGAFYSYEGERIGQGRDNARKFLKENPDIFDAIDEKLRAEFLANPNELPLDVIQGVSEDDSDDLDDDEFEL